MPPRIATILDRLRQDLAAGLSPEAIATACVAVGHTWKDGVLNPVMTVYLFLLQILHGNTACQHVVHFGGWAFTDSAYCQARKRLPLGVLQSLVRHVRDAAPGPEPRADGRWHGHRTVLIDGSGFSMPDVPALQAHFGQPGAQRPGCGFPVARLLAAFDAATGLLLEASAAPLRSHDMTGVERGHDALRPGDVLVGDRGLCSFVHLALLVNRRVHAVFRVHQRQIVDFTPGRRHVRTGHVRGGEGLPRSRWLRLLGTSDQVVEWSKPPGRPAWMTAEAFAGLAASLTVRELRYRVATPGFRTREVTLVTTLLDAGAYPKEELAGLYLRRWRVEVDLRDLKQTMKMDVLKCKTVDGVMKELAVYALVHNLIRAVMVEAAGRQGVEAERLSFVDALRWLRDAPDDAMPALKVNPARPGRAEPRAVKRRPKGYRRLVEPRAEWKKRVLGQEDAA
jgi:hypothetical protein